MKHFPHRGLALHNKPRVLPNTVFTWGENFLHHSIQMWSRLTQAVKEFNVQGITINRCLLKILNSQPFILSEVDCILKKKLRQLVTSDAQTSINGLSSMRNSFLINKISKNELYRRWQKTLWKKHQEAISSISQKNNLPKYFFFFLVSGRTHRCKIAKVQGLLPQTLNLLLQTYFWPPHLLLSWNLTHINFLFHARSVTNQFFAVSFVRLLSKWMLLSGCHKYY